MNSSRLTRSRRYMILMALGAAIPAVAADETTSRLDRAAAVLGLITEPSHGVKPEYLAAADCIVAIPGFKKGAAVIGVGYGRGYMPCRNAQGWPAPVAMALESGSVGVQIGGESIDIVILLLDKEHRGKLLGERFAIGSDASVAWGNGKSAHEEPNAQFVFYGFTKGVFGGFGLDGATLKCDESGDKDLHGTRLTTNEIVAGCADTPAVASRFIAALPRE